MSQENVEVARQAYDAVNRRDLDAFLELMDPEVVALPRQAAMEGGYRGHAGIRRWWGDLLNVFPDFAVEVIDVRDLGDMTLAALRFLGHGADSESPFDETVWGVSELRDGKAIWWRTYNTEDEALQAVRLRVGGLHAAEHSRVELRFARQGAGARPPALPRGRRMHRLRCGEARALAAGRPQVELRRRCWGLPLRLSRRLRAGIAHSDRAHATAVRVQQAHLVVTRG